LALAFSTHTTIRTQNDCACREASHTSHGDRKLPVGTETDPGGAGKVGRHGLRQNRREVTCEASIEESRRRDGAIFLPRMPAKSGPATSSASRRSSSGQAMPFSSFITPVAKSCMSEPRVIRPASGRDSKSSRLAVGIVSRRAFLCMTATAATERLSIAGSANWASHRSALRSDRPRPTPSRSGG
jgi:hypothetical protein